ncbi:MAG TPA: N-acetylmuramoyl-L-alanine amidase [Acidobacteriaceae bacterium]|nr:N-acetylmuramoyl-L-alanine amidase [Acidobacteriaceae bacterium]
MSGALAPEGKRRIRFAKLLPILLLLIPTLLAGQTPPQPQTLPPAPAPSIPAPAPPQVALKYTVLLDAAHGGNDTGARLSPNLLEKDLTLDLANRLRSMLVARGIEVAETRTSDTSLSADQRAEIANKTPFSACILIHATATGSGVHLYTSSLAPTPPQKFMPWRTAQSAYTTQSLKLLSDMESAFAHAEIPITLGRTALQPMDSFACPAVAVEVAPLHRRTPSKTEPLDNPDYQRAVLDALSAALAQWRGEWRQQP